MEWNGEGIIKTYREQDAGFVGITHSLKERKAESAKFQRGNTEKLTQPHLQGLL